jgi:hypothetical protein
MMYPVVLSINRMLMIHALLETGIFTRVFTNSLPTHVMAVVTTTIPQFLQKQEEK